MIGSLCGTVAALSLENCLIETSGGVGYRVFMPQNQLAQLSMGQQTRLEVHTAVREDAILLYGFLHHDSYELFTILLTVSGVGPKVALGILSAVKPESFYRAIRSKDVKMLTQLPGIGKKTAERMLLELKEKISGTETTVGGSSPTMLDNTASGAIAEAIEALISLGYSSSEILPVLEEIPDCEKLPVELILPQALKIFAKGKH